MADAKISQLTAATTPLAGTEVLPIVQSGSTVKVANNDLRPKQIQSNATSGVLQIAGPAAAATRVMTVPDANFTAARTDAANSFTGDQTLSTGNLVQGTAAKGVNFTANTPAAGMTSQLLNWYEEGTWTMGFSVASGSVPVLAGYTTGRYTRVGRLVTVTGLIVADTTTAPSGLLKITGLPFTCANSDSAKAGVAIYGQGFTGTVNSLVAFVDRNSTEITIKSLAAGSVSDIGAYMTQYSQFIISATYAV